MKNYDGSIREFRETLEPSPEPLKPTLIKYSLSRPLENNLALHFFDEMEELVTAIKEASKTEKWLIFVSSKRIGKGIYKELEGYFKDKRQVVFVDADYGLKGHEDAMEEVTAIIQRGRLTTDILICTSVLDNGINIHDPKLCNMAIMADDEVEFLQMLGRKRLDNENEKLHLFLPRQNSSYFSKREQVYLDWYWRLCNNLQFHNSDVYPLLEKASLTMQDISNCHNLIQGIFYVNPLAMDEIQSKYVFCSEMSERLQSDKNAFLKEQLHWLGIEYTSDFFIRHNIRYSQENVDQITSSLVKIYKHEGGLIPKDQFNKLKQSILAVVSAMDRSYEKKAGNPATVNAALQLLPDWKQYQFSPIQLGKSTFYELLLDNRACIRIDNDKMTPDSLKDMLFSCQGSITEKCFENITGCPIPTCLANNDARIKALLNEKMASTDHLKGYMIKNQSGSSLQLMPRPKK